MESNGLPGRMFSGMSSGMLGLEMPLHQHPNPHHQQQQPQNPHHLHHPQMVASYAHHDPDHHHHHHQNPQPHQSAKQLYPYATKTKQQALVSDEDEPGSAADDGITTTDGKKKTSPWQRMKWTDNMVRLLIMAVYYIGDEAGPEASDGKKKGGGAGLLQKKGKWKSVSRAMMEKGFYVSPQQCEDKFNDLNKRYKRVNDILGKGTACRVVENQSLLESMDLSPKMKDEVRKLLNSKHLFFREMCAYHNSCGHGGTAGAQQSPEDPSEPAHLLQQQQQQVQQPCLHSSGKVETEDDDENDEDDDDSENDDEEEGSRSRGQCGHRHEDDDENDERFSQKRSRRNGPSGPSSLLQQLNHEMNTILQDSSKTSWEKKHWIKTRLMQLEEQQMNYNYQAFELEKQRLKWMKFSSKKEREMERAKLENERRRLENERMVLVIRQKELELVDLHHQQQLSSNRKADPSSITG